MRKTLALIQVSIHPSPTSGAHATVKGSTAADPVLSGASALKDTPTVSVKSHKHSELAGSKLASDSVHGHKVVLYTANKAPPSGLNNLKINISIKVQGRLEHVNIYIPINILTYLLPMSRLPVRVNLYE